MMLQENHDTPGLYSRRRLPRIADLSSLEGESQVRQITSGLEGGGYCAGSNGIGRDRTAAALLPEGEGYTGAGCGVAVRNVAEGSGGGGLATAVDEGREAGST